MNTESQVNSKELDVRPVEELAKTLAELDPKPVTKFTPDNLEEVMEDFLRGKRRNPDNATYPSLDSLDFEELEKQYKSLLQEVINHPDIPSKQHKVYEEYVNRSINIIRLMNAAYRYRNEDGEDKKQQAKQDFEQINHELYGKPDPETAALMRVEIISDSEHSLDEDIVRIREEFTQLTEDDFPNVKMVRLEPSDDAKKFVSRIVEVIYAPLLKTTNEVMAQIAAEQGVKEDKLKLTPDDLAKVFQTVIEDNFPSSGWNTKVEKANAIKVVASEKEVIIPEKRASVDTDKARGLVIHELGVHMMRSIIGEKADLIPLRYGLANVNDAEEGIAKVMESSISGDGARIGYQHYLTAHLLNQGKDFRDAFEIMWRYKVLDACLDKPEVVINDSFIQKQKETAFKFMFRSIRGTNELPWHLTLSYYNGTKKIWDYAENHIDDPDTVTLMFMGKIDPTNIEHLSAALDAKPRAV